MSFQRFQPWVLVSCLAACVGSLVIGCDNGDRPGSEISDQTAAGSGETTTELKALAANATPIRGATQVVSAGTTTAQSAHYQMIFTLGQATQNQDMSRSPNYELQGGLVGANRRLK